MPIFYHFTCIEHLPEIRATGVLLPSESNIGSGNPSHFPYGSHYGPDVVWLLDTPDANDYSHGLVVDGYAYDKRAVRIAVDVPAIRWVDWAPVAWMNKDWRKHMVDAGGGEEAAAHWYVFPGPIRWPRWHEIVVGSVETPST